MLPLDPVGAWEGDTPTRDHRDETVFRLMPLVLQSFVCTMATMTFTALVGPIGRALGLYPWQMGVAVTAGGLSWIMTARAWGNASDRYGRRPILLGGLGGFAVAYAGLCLLTAGALHSRIPSLAIFAGLVAGRTLAGAFFAAVPTAGAAMVADHVLPERRAAAMGTLGMANASAMVISPAVASFIAPYDLALPLLVSATLPIVAFVLSWRLLPRKHIPYRPEALEPLRLTDRKLRRPLVVAFTSMLALATAQMVIGFYAIDRLSLSLENGAHVAGIALSCVGIALTLAQTLIRTFRWPPEHAIRLGAGLSSIAFLGVVFITTAPHLYVCYFLAATGLGLIWPSVSALAANAVAPHEQGATAGAITAAQGMGSVLGPVLGTAIYAADIATPYIVLSLLLAALVPWKSQSRTIPR